MNAVREMAVAGLFYPDNAQQLQQMFASWMQQAPLHTSMIPRALILPHAGYIYSGQAAAKGYQFWQAAASQIKTIVVMGPAHRVRFDGMATVTSNAVATPLGNLAVDTVLRDLVVEQFTEVGFSDQANDPEHSLEVHFPFLKNLLPSVRVLPLLNGFVEPEAVSEVLRFLWQQPDVYFVISTDLSHFKNYQDAQQFDRQTAALVNRAQWQALDGEMACGYKGLQGLLRLTEHFDLTIEQCTLINSGDTAGDKARVVGYGTWAIYDQVPTH